MFVRKFLTKTNVNDNKRLYCKSILSSTSLSSSSPTTEWLCVICDFECVFFSLAAAKSVNRPKSGHQETEKKRSNDNNHNNNNNQKEEIKRNSVVNWTYKSSFASTCTHTHKCECVSVCVLCVRDLGLLTYVCVGRFVVCGTTLFAHPTNICTHFSVGVCAAVSVCICVHAKW